MRDVDSPSGLPRRFPLAAIVCFAVAGLANAPLGTPRSLLAVLATVLGVYAVARYARGVDRRRLVRTAIGLWFCVVVVVGVSGVLGTSGAVRIGLWVAVLAATSTTAFLGFREYAASTTPAGAPEGDYRTR